MELLPGLGIKKMKPMRRFRAIMVFVFGFYRRPACRPDLIIGAGHGTHLTLLALKRFWHAPIVVMMKPSVPLRCFDLCLIPEHDHPPERANVIATRGALNRVRPARKRPGSGMVLIGGPSKNSDWDEARLLEQVGALVHHLPGDWLLTTSRRTPPSTIEKLRKIKGIDVVSSETTSEGWLPEKLASTEQCWVTEDSVSMIYEALTAGCAVGVLEVPWRTTGRLLRGVMKLKERGFLASFDSWSGEPLPPKQYEFNEARRCAEIITERGLL